MPEAYRLSNANQDWSSGTLVLTSSEHRSVGGYSQAPLDSSEGQTTLECQNVKLMHNMLSK